MVLKKAETYKIISRKLPLPVSVQCCNLRIKAIWKRQTVSNIMLQRQSLCFFFLLTIRLCQMSGLKKYNKLSFYTCSGIQRSENEPTNKKIQEMLQHYVLSVINGITAYNVDFRSIEPRFIYKTSER